jgi:hypothetical protein
MAEVFVEYKDRRVPRHPFTVDIVVTDIRSGIQITERTQDLSHCGCSVKTESLFPAGTKIRLTIAHQQKEIIAFGKVIYDRPDIGMGIVFTAIEPADQKLVDAWIDELDASP